MVRVDVEAGSGRTFWDHVLASAQGMPEVIDLEGVVDEDRNLRYIGNARRQENGKYHCLAVIEDGSLCVVEVSVARIYE